MRPRDNRCHPSPNNYASFTASFLHSHLVPWHPALFLALIRSLIPPSTNPHISHFFLERRRGARETPSRYNVHVGRRVVILTTQCGSSSPISPHLSPSNPTQPPVHPPIVCVRIRRKRVRIHGCSRHVRTLALALSLTLRYGFTVVRTYFVIRSRN